MARLSRLALLVALAGCNAQQAVLPATSSGYRLAVIAAHAEFVYGYVFGCPGGWHTPVVRRGQPWVGLFPSCTTEIMLGRVPPPPPPNVWTCYFWPSSLRVKNTGKTHCKRTPTELIF